MIKHNENELQHNISCNTVSIPALANTTLVTPPKVNKNINLQITLVVI